MKFPVDIFPLVLLLFWLFAGCSTRTGSPPPATAKRAEGVYHVVRSGENLYRIGKAYDVPYEELARVNGIKNAGQIHVGQRIFIPGTTRQLPVATITPLEAARPAPNAPESGCDQARHEEADRAAEQDRPEGRDDDPEPRNDDAPRM